MTARRRRGEGGVLEAESDSDVVAGRNRGCDEHVTENAAI
jgi:hypothetical protein